MAKGISVEIKFNRFPALRGSMPKVVEGAVRKGVADIEGDAKVRCPKDTGALANSIAGTMTGPTSGQVSVGQEYGVYVEYGTSRGSPAQPFLHPAFDAQRPGIEAGIKSALDAA